MNREEYEVRRQALEEQHCADVALLNAAHGLRLRSLERLWRGAVEGEQDAMALATTVREPDSVAPDPAPTPMRARYAVLNDLEAAFPSLPQEFDRKDIIRALGYAPPRTTLLRALNLFRQEGIIDIVAYSPGGMTTSYRKTAPAS
ncbi:MAG: hypothetical protein QOH06_1376 [Acidobacteriota bacterium]|jgi:hypothetical protein|nr:hypothetical protein [Acidobacteriota bacterium]